MRSLIIGIAGGSGSGKSTIAKALQKKYMKTTY